MYSAMSAGLPGGGGCLLELRALLLALAQAAGQGKCMLEPLCPVLVRRNSLSSFSSALLPSANCLLVFRCLVRST